LLRLNTKPNAHPTGKSQALAIPHSIWLKPHIIHRFTDPSPASQAPRKSQRNATKPEDGTQRFIHTMIFPIPQAKAKYVKKLVINSLPLRPTRHRNELKSTLASYY
jgi:hypothetical protein